MKIFTIRGYSDFFPDLARLEEKGKLTMDEIIGLQRGYLTDVADIQVGEVLSFLVDQSEALDFVVSMQGVEGEDAE